MGVLKMDIEGAETLALRGADRLLRERLVRNLVLELHPPQIAALGSSAPEIIRTLREIGYHLWAVDHSLVTSRAVAYGRLRHPGALLKPLRDDALDAWPHVLASREQHPLA